VGKTYDLLIRARGDTNDAQRAMKQLERHVYTTGRKMASFGRSMTMAITLPLAALATMGVRELMETRKVTMQTNAVFKSMGGVLKVTKGQFNDLVTDLSRYSAIEGDIIQSNANVALSFSELAKNPDLFKDTMKAAIDMAGALDMETQAAVIMLGKAMNNGAKGAAALTKNGTLSKLEMEELKKMAEEGLPLWKQQEYILRKVNAQYAGQGKNTDPIKAMIVAVKDLAESLAVILMPAITRVSNIMIRLSGWIQGLNAKQREMIGIAAIVAAAMGPVIWALGQITMAASVLVPVLAGISLPVAGVIAAVVALGVALVVAYRKSEQFRAIVQRSFRSLRSGAVSVLGDLRKTIDKWGVWARQFWSRWGGDITRLALGALQHLQRYFSRYLSMYASIVRAGLAVLRGDWGSAAKYLRSAMSSAWGAVKAIVRAGVAAVKTAVQGLANGVAALTGKFISAAYKIGAAIIDGMVDGVRAGAGRLAAAAQDAVKISLDGVRVKLKIHSPSRVFRDQVGAPIAEGMALGIRRNTHLVETASRELAKAAVKGARHQGKVNVFGELIGGNITAAQVLRYVHASTRSAFSYGADGEVKEDHAVTSFLRSRIQESSKRLNAYTVRRTRCLSQLKVMRRRLKKSMKARAIAKRNGNDAAYKKWNAIVNKQKRQIGELDGLLEFYNDEIMSLGGSIVQDQESLEPPDPIESGGDAEIGEDGETITIPGTGEASTLPASNGATGGVKTWTTQSGAGITVHQTFYGEVDPFVASRDMRDAILARVGG
jgi:hypothetical protein